MGVLYVTCNRLRRTLTRESNAIFFFDGFIYYVSYGEILFILSFNHFYSYRVRTCACA